MIEKIQFDFIFKNVKIHIIDFLVELNITNEYYYVKYDYSMVENNFHIRLITHQHYFFTNLK